MSESSPKDVRIADLAQMGGEQVRLRGWLYNSRGKGKMLFLLLRDGSGICQCVVRKDLVDEESFENAKRSTQESSVLITGAVQLDDRAPGGAEVVADTVEVHQIAEPYPIGKKEHGPGFLMDHRHLWLRSKKQMALLRVRHRVLKSFREFLDDQGFFCVDSPIFTPNACEGTSTLFETEYFDDKAFLTQSGQLYAEASAMALGKVYCFGPTFRAEKSKTRRHLTEFWMLEPEMAWANLEDVCDLAEGMIRYTIRQLLEHSQADLADLERAPATLEGWDRDWPRLRYDDAAKMLLEWQAEKKYESDFKPGDDLGAPDETALGEHFGCPVMVTHWPKEVKAFYMKRDPEDESRVLGVDIIAPTAGEIVGGAVREDNYDVLLGRIHDHDLPEEAFEWYLDLRKFGSVPHGGFGIGLERTVSWLAGVEHVRECIPFPRTLQRIYP
ncbi:MAG: asparagine--tRNA ligase [Planctomycetota bacterium]|jgi:asparaginyl-tRNA synthetase|nr:asparagine--tRNA ligase [Planctomycetota bacterium]MDP6942247.1 asparagine--tRNA ligase [Planctomycetota bacterium]